MSSIKQKKLKLNKNRSFDSRNNKARSERNIKNESFEKNKKEKKRPDIKLWIDQEIKVTGKFIKSKFFGMVVPDSRIITNDIYITVNNFGDAQDGDKVVCKIINNVEGVNGEYECEGKIIRVLGKSGDISAELESIYYKYNFDKNFTEKVKLEADRIKTNFKTDSRLDLREIFTITVDPEDAKDFDDAISIQLIDKNEYLLGIHIADVSYFVKQDSAIDLEAMSRGTSVYLVNKVVPMLPERISNDICSLKENEDRLTFSVLIKLNKSFKILDYEIKESIIRSNKRFTYEAVQDILDKKKGDYVDNLLLLMNISKRFYKMRMKKGSLDFDSTEVKIYTDKDNNITDIKIKPRLNSMRMIEEFMLLANKCVTEYVHQKAKSKSIKLPFIYRIHDKPDNDKLSNLTQFIKQFGYNIDLDDKASLIQLLELIKSKQESFIINDLLIRSMAKAKYDNKNIGHYGLGFVDYTHFTSPIRRYPDLVVHRLLKRYLKNDISIKSLLLNEKKVEEICKISTDKEQNAVNAEREFTKILQINYLSKFIGHEFEGIISGIVSYGMFVELSEFLVEGLVRFRDLEDDYYQYDESSLLVTGRRRGKVFRAGQKVIVKIINTNLESRKLDLVIV